MAGSLYMLRDFFKTGRKASGAYMGDNECVLNATQRNLSTQTNDELLALRDSALLFIAECDATFQEREIVPYWSDSDRKREDRLRQEGVIGGRYEDER